MKSPLQVIRPKSMKSYARHLHNLVVNKLWIQILVALVLGVSLGILLSSSTGFVEQSTAQVIGDWIAIPGELFLGVIQMIVVPLVFTSVITGLAASEDMSQLKSVGLRVVGFFVITTTIAIIIGILLTSAIQPGTYIDSTAQNLTMDETVVSDETQGAQTPSASQLPSFITNIIPNNPLSSMVEKEMLQVVLFAVVIGIALISLSPEQSQPLLKLLSSIQEVTMIIVKWAMLLAPFAVFGLITRTTIQMGVEVLLGMAVYVGTVIGGLLILLSVYLLITWFVSKQSPFQFLAAVREVLLLAFSTSSSAAVMPLSIETAENKLNVKSSISQFVVPLGATINMTGTALYQGAATIFLAQVFDVQLSLSAIMLIILTTVGASIGSPATPGVGIVILAMVLNSVGIPTAGIALILGVDRILDMCRTAVNVAGDLTACVTMQRYDDRKKEQRAGLGSEATTTT